MKRITDQLPPALALRIGPTTQAGALTCNQTLTTWLLGQCSTTEPHWAGQVFITEPSPIKNQEAA